MKKIIKSTAVVLIIMSLTSCGYGYSIDQKFTPLDASQTQVVCTTLPENVELFFEGETYNFQYEKQGMIEVQGDRYAKDADLIEKLKKLAKSKCCDAVINLKKNYVNRESGFLFSSEPTEKYSAITYFGIAVKKK